MVSKTVKKKTWIVIAAYNEEKKISDVIKDLKKHGYKNIAVVDDGSSDKTVEKAEKAGAEVLIHAVNRGQGASLKTGIDYALHRGAEYVVTFDADGQHQAKDLERMIPPVASGKYDVALGSRFIEGAAEIPTHRKILLKGSVLVQRFFYGVILTDAHNGFRVLSRKAAEAIRITSDRMEHASEISEEIFTHELKHKEVPVDIIYSDYSLAKGHGSLWGGIKILGQALLRKLLK